MTDVRLYAVAFVLWVEKWEDYVRIFGLRVDRGRVESIKVPRSCRLPFLGLCVQNGSPRDACSRWFTCGFVKGPQTPHSTLLLVFDFTHWTLSDARAIEQGPQGCATVTECVGPQPRMYLDGPDRSAVAGASQLQIVIRLYRSSISTTRDWATLSINRRSERTRW